MNRKLRVLVRFKRSLTVVVIVYGLALCHDGWLQWFSSDELTAGSSVKTAIILTLGAVTPSEEDDVLGHEIDKLHYLSAQLLFDDLLKNCSSRYHGVIVYENAHREWFGNWEVELVPTSRETERRAWGPAYEAFSGIYGAPVKPAAIRWVAENKKSFRSAWCLEPDVVLAKEPWHSLFDKYDANDSDLVAFNVTFRHKNKHLWNHWKGCSFCRGLAKASMQAGLLPAFRFSQRFAKEMYNALRSTNTSAHHEVFIPTFATAHGFSWTDLAPEIGYVEWRPIIDARLLHSMKESVKTGALYHPIKSPRIFQHFIANHSRTDH